MSETDCPLGRQKHGRLCCKHCPKGQYVKTDCSSNSDPECEKCPHNTFTETDNYMKNCLSCSQCEPSNQQVIKACSAESNTQCGCAKGFYCVDPSKASHCYHCRPLTHCPPGEGVIHFSTNISDTKCGACPEGTFSNVTDYSTRCYSHTSCDSLGRYLLTPGTHVKDAVCGDLISYCRWMLPAGLVAGLIITVLLVTTGLLYRRVKRISTPPATKGQVSFTKYSARFTPPEFPPDIIKHPGSPDLHEFTQIDEVCPSEQHCILECDGLDMRTMTMSEKFCPSTTALMCEPSTLQSQPQEDEWPGA